MSDTHKVMTHLLSCYVQSVVVKYYLQFHRHIFLHVELFILLCGVCFVYVAKEAQKFPFVSPNFHLYGLGVFVVKVFLIFQIHMSNRVNCVVNPTWIV